MRIVTRSGRKYTYSTLSNKISLGWNKSLYADIFPVAYTDTIDYSFDKISMFTIEVTQQCNLRCKYCIYSGEYENRRPHTAQAFPPEEISSLISFIYSHADESAPVITICFYGGEALLQRETITTIIRELEHLEFTFEYTISTNGVMLSKDTIEWICSIPNLKVTVTIDGDKAIHDRNRIFPDGRGSYDIVMKNLQSFKNQYPSEYNRRIQFLATIDSVSRLKELSGFWNQVPLLAQHRPVHISPIIPNFSRTNIPDRSLLLRNQLIIYDEALISYMKGEENILTDELKRLIGILEHREFFELPGQQRFITCCHAPYSCFITTTGELFVCEKFNTQFSVGDIYRGFNENSLKAINTLFTERKNNHCAKCWAKRLCRICATNINHSDSEFEYFCALECQKIQLAIKYYCEIKEYESDKSRKPIPPIRLETASSTNVTKISDE